MKNLVFYLKLFFYMIYVQYKRMKYETLKKKGLKEKADDYLYDSVKKWAQFTIKSLGIKLNISGLENIPEENCVFVSNHQGNMDIPVLLAAIDKSMGFIAKKELSNVPFISYWMREIKCTFMDRSNVREAVKSINEGIQALKEGQSMVIFPEGTRSKSSTIGEFKKGSMKLATKSRKPILPITLDGTYKALESKERKSKNKIVNIIIDKPIYLDNLDKEEINNLHDIVKDIIQSNMDKIKASI